MEEKTKNTNFIKRRAAPKVLRETILKKFFQVEKNI